MSAQLAQHTPGASTEAPPIGTTPAWLALSDELLAGFCHELGGRASAFVSIAHLATRQSVRTGFVLGEIERESEQLARLANLLRVLPRNADTTPRAVALPPTLGEVVELARYHHGLRAVEFELDCPNDLPALRLDRNAFIQSVLILLADSVRRAVRARRSALRLSARTLEDGSVELEITSQPPSAADSGISSWLDTPPPAIDEASLEAVTRRWSSREGRVERTEHGYRILLAASNRLSAN